MQSRHSSKRCCNLFAYFAKKGCKKVSVSAIHIMEYTKEQKKAMSKVLLEIVSIDEHLVARETLYFEKVKDVLELSTKDLLYLNTLRCLSIIKTLSAPQKVELAKMMRGMILADEFIDPNEAVSFYDICEFVHVNGVGLTND